MIGNSSRLERDEMDHMLGVNCPLGQLSPHWQLGEPFLLLVNLMFKQLKWDEIISSKTFAQVRSYGLTHFLLATFTHAWDTIHVAFPFLGNIRKRHSYKAENLSKIMVLKGLKKTIADKAEIKTVGLRTRRTGPQSRATAQAMTNSKILLFLRALSNTYILLLILVYKSQVFSKQK